MVINLHDYILKSTGKLRKYTDLGCYPLLYVTKSNQCLCADCATNNDEDYDPIVAVDANWENPLLFCDDCNNRIESAYAEDLSVMDALRD